MSYDSTYDNLRETPELNRQLALHLLPHFRNAEAFVAIRLDSELSFLLSLELHNDKASSSQTPRCLSERPIRRGTRAT